MRELKWAGKVRKDRKTGRRRISWYRPTRADVLPFPKIVDVRSPAPRKESGDASDPRD